MKALQRFLKALTIASTALLLGLAGCALPELEENVTAADTDSAGGSPETAPDPLTLLQGTWSTSCKQVESLYELWTYSVSGTDATQEFSVYADASCQTLLVTRSEGHHEISVGDEMTISFEDSSLADARGYRFTSSTGGATATVHSADLLQMFNDESVCGISWGINVAHDVSGKSCTSTGVGSVSFLPNDQTGYSNFSFVDDKLYLGYPRYDGVFKDSVWARSYKKQ